MSELTQHLPALSLSTFEDRNIKTRFTYSPPSILHITYPINYLVSDLCLCFSTCETTRLKLLHDLTALIETTLEITILIET